MARDISVALELDNRQFNRSIKQSEQNVDGFSKRSKTGVNSLKTAFIALGGAAVLKSIVEVGASFQDLQNSLNVVFGSVEAGADAFARVQDFAAGTQFSVQTLTQAFVQLKGAGVEPTEDMLGIFADTASVTTDQMGTFQAALDLVSRSTAGGLGLEDLNRLADRGIPVFQILGERLGLTRLEVSNFGKTAEGANTIVKELLSGLDERFGGSLEASSKNLNFAFSQLKDASESLQAAIFSLFGAEATAGVQNLTSSINSLADSVRELGVSGGAKIFFDLVKGIALIGGSLLILNKLPRGLTAVGDALMAMRNSTVGITVLKTLKKTVAGLGPSFVAIFTNMVRAAKSFLGLNLAAGFSSIGFSLKALAGFLLRFAGLAGVITGLVLVIDNLVEAFTGFSIIDSITGLLKLAAQQFGFFKEKVEEVAEVVEEETEDLKANAKAAAEAQRQKELATLAEESFAKGLRGTTKAIKEQTEAFDKNDPLFDYMKFLAAIFEEAEQNLSGLSNLTKALENVQIMLDIDPSNVRLIEAMRILTEMAESAKNEYTETNQALLDFADVTDTLAKSTENYNMLLERLVELQTQGKITAEEFKQAKADLDEAFTENEGIENFLETLGRAQKKLSEDLADAFVEGKSAMSSFQDFFKTLIKQIIADIIRLSIIQPILSSILSPFGYGFGSGGNILKLAGGGRIMGNQPAIVGEEGPELFMPSTAGTVIPNGQFGMSAPSQQVTYNINAVDTQSFQQALARDPEFLFAVTQQGARSLPRS